MRANPWRSAVVLIATILLVFFVDIAKAHAVPSYARKYQTSCLTCHTVFPKLNPFGEAFRRNGYRMPSQEGSKDTDAIKAEMIPMGQEAYEKMFPRSVWPDKINDAVPLSAMANGGVAVNMPGSDARDANGNIFTWDGIMAEFHIFGAGSFSDTVTYFSQLTFDSSGVDIETGYLLWNDIIGPRHLVNLWVGRLMAPSLTSWGLHSSYMGDLNMPELSVGGLYNPAMDFAIGTQAHADGMELNGIVGHRVDYALGWLVSGIAGDGLQMPNAENVYAHLGAKIGGLSLDGEGGSITPDAMRPWAETSLTIDAFAYHGRTMFDNGTGANFADPPPIVVQGDRFTAIGGQLRAYLGSLEISAGAQYEHHAHPYPGQPGTAADPTTTPPTPARLGAPDYASADAIVQYDELDYVVYPWLVPGVRSELTRLNLKSANLGPLKASYAALMRVMPGVALLVRPNIKVVVSGDFEWAHGLPPVGAWDPAGGYKVAAAGASTKVGAEQINGALFWAF